jgi:hypothetical protein
MPAELQIFYGVAIIASAVMLMQTILMLLGGHHDLQVGGMDGGGTDGHVSGLHVFSVRAVTAFCTGFGWGGVCSLDAGLGLVGAILVALVCGVALVVVILSIMRSLTSLGESGTLDYQNAIGAVGTVYIPIPPAQGGKGQIEIMVQGRLAIVDACTNATNVLASRTRVTVVALQGQNLLIVSPIV